MRSPKLVFDGELFDVVGSECKSGPIQLRLWSTTYKTYHGTCGQLIRSRTRPRRDLPNPLSVGIVAISSDRKLVLGLRSSWVQGYPRYIDIPAGYVDPKSDWTGNKPDPFKSVRRELQEELVISKGAISRLACIGMLENVPYHSTIVIFSRRVDTTSNKLRNREEFDQVILVCARKRNIMRLIDEWGRRLSPTCTQSLLLWLASQG